MSEAKYFRLRLETPDTFIKLMKILGKLLDYAELTISPKSLTLLAMDGSHVVNINLQLPGTFFNEYTVNSGRVIRIDLQELNKVLSRARGEALYLMDCGSENKLLVQFQSAYKRNFKTNLYDSIEESKPLDQIDYNASVGFLTGDIAEIIGDAHLVSDYATISIIRDILGDYVEVDTGPTSESGMQFNVKITAFAEAPLTAKSEAAQYSLEYLNDILKLKDVATKVRLQLSTNKPMCLTFPLENDGQVILTLAPRIADEEKDSSMPESKGEPIEEESEKDSQEESEDEEEPEDSNEKVHEHIATVYKRNGRKKKPEAAEATEL